MAASKVLLHIFNVIFSILGLCLAAGAIWFFVQVNDITALRNINHYLLDYRVYWPQIIPWLFFFIGIFIFFTSCCGLFGASKNSKSLIVVYVIFVSVFVVLLLAAAVIALIFADKKSTDDFIEDAFWDVFLQSKNDKNVADEFGYIERKLHCCGATSPRDYRSFRDELPQSCCDVFSHGWLEQYPLDCSFTSKMANERHGCSTVAVWYARITIKVLSGASIVTAFIGLINLIISIGLFKSLKKKPVHLSAKYESDSKKVLL